MRWYFYRNNCCFVYDFRPVHQVSLEILFLHVRSQGERNSLCLFSTECKQIRINETSDCLLIRIKEKYNLAIFSNGPNVIRILWHSVIFISFLRLEFLNLSSRDSQLEHLHISRSPVDLFDCIYMTPLVDKLEFRSQKLCVEWSVDYWATIWPTIAEDIQHWNIIDVCYLMIFAKYYSFI